MKNLFNFDPLKPTTSHPVGNIGGGGLGSNLGLLPSTTGLFGMNASVGDNSKSYINMRDEKQEKELFF